jgi:hypothetical protein
VCVCVYHVIIKRLHAPVLAVCVLEPTNVLAWSSEHSDSSLRNVKTSDRFCDCDKSQFFSIVCVVVVGAVAGQCSVEGGCAERLSTHC